MILRIRQWGTEDWIRVTVSDAEPEEVYADLAEGLRAFAASWAERYHVQMFDGEGGWEDLE